MYRRREREGEREGETIMNGDRNSLVQCMTVS